MGSLRYIQNYPLKLKNDHWHWWMVMFGAMPIEILTAKCEVEISLPFCFLELLHIHVQLFR